MRIPCNRCGCMMQNINRECTKFECPECGRIINVAPLRKQNLIKTGDDKIKKSRAANKTKYKVPQKITRGKTVKFNVEKYKKLRAEGMKLVDISTEMDIDYKTLYTHRKKHGLLKDKKNHIS